MADKKIITNLSGGVLEIILNNPAKMNCIGFEMLYNLKSAVEKADKDESVRAVVFKGAGDRAFSTGADLKEYQSLSSEQTERWIEIGNMVFDSIEDLSKPSVAFINGYAIGGGLELALACDFRVGTQTAILSSAELLHGWLPGWGGIERLRRLFGEAKAKEIVMLCEKIPASKAYQLGLLNKIEGKGTEETEKMIGHLKGLKTRVFELAKVALKAT